MDRGYPSASAMRKKKLLKNILLTLLVLTSLVLLFIAAFLYNPFEGSLADFRRVVPRDVDFFVRKERLGEDFPADRFPEPHFWSELVASDPWRSFERGPLVRELRQQGIETSLGELQRALQETRQQSGGQLDIFADGIGNEVIVAGWFHPPRIEETEWCAYLRVSWRIKFLWGLLRFTAVQEKLRQNGMPCRTDGEFLVLEPPGGKSFHVGRYRDCLMIASSKRALESAWKLANQGGEALGASADYRDGVELRLDEWQKRTGVPRANAVEIYLRPDQIDPILGVADKWPNPNAPQDMNERVLASFLNLKGWRFLTGSLIFEDKSLTLLGKIDLDRNRHTPFQTRFFQTEQENRASWLNPFLGMVPLNSCACAAMRMPAGEFLREMFRALEQPARETLNDAARKTGKYESVNALFDRLDPALLPRTGFVFRKNVPDKDIKVAIPSPVPQIAWVFWIREGMKAPLKELIEVLNQHAETFQLKAYLLKTRAGKEGDVVREFANPQIEGTGEFALAVFDRFFVISNSGPLIKDMYNSLLDQFPSVQNSPALKRFHDENEIPSAVNGFVYVQGKEMQQVLEDYQMAFERSQGSPDPEWMLANRQGIEAQVFRDKYAARFGSIAALDPASKAQFGRDVDAMLQEQWRRQGQTVSDAERQSIRQALAMSRMCQAACVYLNLDPQWIKVSGRVLVEYR